MAIGTTREQVLALVQKYNKQYSEGMASRWKPPEGEYLCIGAGFSIREGTEANPEPALVPRVRILDGQYADRYFELGWFRPTFISNIGPIYNPKTGEPPADMAEVYLAFEATFGPNLSLPGSDQSGTGKVMVVSVTIGRKGYLNCTIKDYPQIEIEPEVTETTGAPVATPGKPKPQNKK